MATYREKRGTNTVPIVAAVPDTGVNGEIVYITGEGLASYNDGTWSKLTTEAPPPDWTATTQQAKMGASDAATNDEMGFQVGISGDTAVAGCYKETNTTGAVYVFTRSGTSWSQQAKLVNSDATPGGSFGLAVDIDLSLIHI